MDKLPIVLDLTGTFVFALSGALAGARRELDLFGVLVLSFAAGNSGGITRDLLIGVVPPDGTVPIRDRFVASTAKDEMELLAVFTAKSHFLSSDSVTAPCEPAPAPVPFPPVANIPRGDSVPS